MFRRTALGQANEHLFHRVDYMVYCEGESADDVSMSLDETFWSRVFSAWNKKVWIKSIGSKTDALAILDDIRDGTLKNTIVALDADYSFYCGNAPDHPQIFFTHGYSWESDAVQNIDFDRALALFCNFRDLAAARAQFLEFIRKNQRVFWRASLIDMRYLECPKQLFNRKKPGSIIKSKPDGLPKLGYAELLSGARSLRNTGKTPMSFPYDGPSSGMRYFFGKTVAKFVYHWFVAFSSRVKGKRSVPYNTFLSALIGAMDIRLGTDQRDTYFRRLLARL